MIPQNQEDREWIGDDYLLSSRDLLEPICYADESEAVKFARSHYCATCLNLLDHKPDDLADGFVVFCRECGDITRSNAVSEYQAEQAKSNIISGNLQIHSANRPKRSVSEIMKDLGF